MKKRHLLAAAISLTLTGSSAFASISNGASAPSDILLALQDNVTQNTFIYNLTASSGLNYKDLISGSSNPISYTWDLNANGYFNGTQSGLASFANHDLTWGIVGLYANQGSATDGAGVKWGELLTAQQSSDFITKNPGKVATDTNNAGVTSNWFVWATPALGSGNAAAIAPNSSNVAYFSEHIFGTPLALSLAGASEAPYTNSNATDSSQNLYWVTSDFITGTGKAVSSTLEGNFTLSANSQLTFTSAATPAAVPLPAGVWLFLSGLVGVLGLNRRNKVAA